MLFPHSRELGILLYRKENADPSKRPVRLGQGKPLVQVSGLESAGLTQSPLESCAELGSLKERKPGYTDCPGPWEVSHNSCTLHWATSAPSAASPYSELLTSPPQPLHKRGMRGPNAKESVSQELAAEPCKVQKLNRGHKPAKPAAKGRSSKFSAQAGRARQRGAGRAGRAGQICPPQTVAGRRRTREWWRDPRCHPLSRSARRAVPGSRRRQSPRHKGGDGSRGPRSREPPNSRRCALTPSRRPQLLPGPAVCATQPAASPGKRGRRARFLPGFLRRGPSSSSAAGVSGRCGSGAGLAGRGQRQHHHVAARRRPRRPGSRGSGKGGANHSPPLPPLRGPKFLESGDPARLSGPDLRELPRTRQRALGGGGPLIVLRGSWDPSPRMCFIVITGGYWKGPTSCLSFRTRR
ncbi:translation initiation factor IF-2 isoform X2 [Desmodus rotundus]|uniref:translation initiation factor IF-2 isoform X2 n=1 Tax=Desmodus rotundus TaxID=9430 RepID=UPI0023810219|nr:translation initiation factor IF-2 isoform X2 [Desmodus rotundus]